METYQTVADDYRRATEASDAHDDTCFQCCDAVEGYKQVRCATGQALVDACVAVLERRSS
jgi:hypothetical protein